MESSAGGEHSLVKTENGKVYSTGSCGLGWCRVVEETTEVLKNLFCFRLVPLPEPAATILASYYHNLAIGQRTGRVYAWGCGTFTDGKNDGVIPALGEPIDADGNGVVEDRGAPPHAVALPPLQCGSAVALAGGAYHSVVLTTAGAVFTWGAAQLGQLGRLSAFSPSSSSTDSSGLPVDPRALPVEGLPHPSSDPPTFIAGGFYNTLVGLRSGELFCCGENQNGQCGVVPSGDSGNSSGRDDDTRNLKVMTRCAALASRDLQAAAAAAGYCHTLVLTPEGDVYSMGCGEDGQRGDGLPADALPAWEGGNTDDSGSSSGVAQRRALLTAVRLPGNRRAAAIAAGANHSVCLATDGKVFAFGSDEFGQCGVRAAATAVGPSSSYSSSSSSSSNENDDNSEESTVLLSPMPIALPPSAGRIVSVSAGYAHTVLRDERGAVFTFGKNESGQLGLGEATAADAADVPCPTRAVFVP
jgi:alpha-tubulin suppressor-like RCC1 family protein